MTKTVFALLLFFSCCQLKAQPSDTLYLPKDTVYELDEVEISAVRDNSIMSGTMSGRIDLKAENLQSLPRFLGTTDMLRTIQLTPGIQTSGELDAGLYIRGCESGHNQVMFNDVPIYNPMHLMGFFSIFNSDHISSSSIYKSYISPQYGGRLSGTVCVSSKSEQAERTSVSGTVGILSSQATLETPVNDKSSLYLSGRGTYVNLLLGLIDLNEESVQPEYGFQDYNLTYTAKPTEKSDMLVNAFFGMDDFSIKEYYYQANGGISWKNAAVSLQWTQQLSASSRMAHTAYYSYYDNLIDVNFAGSQIRFPSRIQDFGYKGKYHFRTGRCYWTAGADYVRHSVRPQYPETQDLFSSALSQSAENIQTHEYGIYAQGSFHLSPQISARLGLRYSGSIQPGHAPYHGLEPRMSLEYEWKNDRKIMFSYTLQRQYMNQIVVSGIGFPTDFWLPASKNIPAQKAHSLSLGYFHAINGRDYEFSVEGYFKRLYNQFEFNGEMLDMVNQSYQIDEHLNMGDGHSYGIEFMFQKHTGRLNGWISYTLGRSTRKFPDINGGKTFPAKNDRRHNLSVVTNYKLNERWELSGIFVYATGSAFTMPAALYLIEENAINEYGPHNGARMPAYHRMDLSASYWFKRNSRRESMINISLYNAYGRENPIYLSVGIEADREKGKVRISPKGQSLYSFVPSISYSFKF